MVYTINVKCNFSTKGDPAMAPEYDPENLYTLTDETGKEQTFELLDVMDVQGRRYFALTPFYPDAQVRLEQPEDLLIMGMVVEDGVEMMASLDSEEEYQEIYELFLARFQQLWEQENPGWLRPANSRRKRLNFPVEISVGTWYTK